MYVFKLSRGRKSWCFWLASCPLVSFSPWNPAVHEEAKERMFTYKVSFTELLFLDFKSKGVGKATVGPMSTLSCSCYVTANLPCCPRDGLRITTREHRYQGCLGWNLDQRSPSAKTTVHPRAEPALLLQWPMEGGTIIICHTIVLALLNWILKTVWRTLYSVSMILLSFNSFVGISSSSFRLRKRVISYVNRQWQMDVSATSFGAIKELSHLDFWIHAHWWARWLHTVPQ